MKKINLRFVIGAALVLALLVPSGLLGQVKKVEELDYPRLPDFNPPKPERFVLDNGMTVILIEDHEMPLIDISARVNTGSRLEPADKVGLAQITGMVLRSGGTTSMPSDKLDEWLEARAAVLETGIGTTSGNAFMSCLKGDFEEVLNVFADVLRNPTFEQDKIDVAKTQFNAGIARQNDDPTQILFREFNEVVYGADSPYARSETYDTINSITRDDLVAWHGKYYHPNRIILGLSGDFEVAEAKAMVQRAFQGWKKGPEPEKVDVAFNKKVDAGVYYVEKADMTQSNIVMGHLGIQKSNPDYYAVEIVNQVLSGSFASRLFSNIRSKKGLAYRVNGSIGSNYDYPGNFNMMMTTKTETTAASIDALFEEAHNLTKLPPTEEEVAKAKAGILNSFVFTSDSTRKILNQQLTYEYFGYPTDWLERYRKGIDEVSIEAIRAAAAKYVHPDRFAIMVVGPEEGQDRPLSEFGQVARVDISIPEASQEEVVASAEGLAKGKKLVDLAVQGLGGAALIDAIDSVQQAGAMVLTMGGGEMEVKVRFIRAYPDRFRTEIVTPMGEMAQVLTPEGAFMKTPQGTQPMPGSMRQEFEKGVLRDVVTMFKRRKDATFQAIASGTGEVNGTSVELVTVQLEDATTVLGIDPSDGRVLSMTYQGTSPGGGAPGELVQQFSDFREVSGLRLPFEYSITFQGDPAGAFTCETVQVDEPVDEAAFAVADTGSAGKGGR